MLEIPSPKVKKNKNQVFRLKASQFPFSVGYAENHGNEKQLTLWVKSKLLQLLLTLMIRIMEMISKSLFG